MPVMAKVATRVKRTKEELIAAQRFANEAQAGGTKVYDLATAPAMRGDAEGALKALARQAARLWKMGALGRFDLRRVDEQGRLLAAGEVEWRAQGAFGIPGREVIAWKVGEHLDEVLALGAERLEACVRTALEKPVGRTVPQTDEEFWTAIGMEQGVPCPGLRERIAKWMHLPLTEEQSRAEAERARTINTGLCRACRDRQETCARCGGRAEKTEIGPTMFVAPGEDGRTYSAPICRTCLDRDDAAEMTIRDGRIVPKVVGVNPIPIPEGDYYFNDYFRSIKRLVADQVRLPAGADSKLTPAHTTFADLLAAWKFASVAVLEPDIVRCSRLLEHLFALGGSKPIGEHLYVGGVAVWVAHTAAQTKDWPRGFDVAVGFGETPTHLRLGLDIPAEDADRFWGMAPAPKTIATEASQHNRALIDAGYDPSAMTAVQIVEAHGRGLLPGLLPGASFQLVDGKVAVVEP